nr:DUF3822 family protein [Allomuricauda sp.]
MRIDTIEKTTTNTPYKKLSIQVGLNGLSFCIIDTIANKVIDADKVVFKTQTTPYLLLRELKDLFDQKGVADHQIADVTVVHQNNLFSLVPKVFFREQELPDYLKFNTKILPSDQIVYDEIENHDMVNVYVPFTNINNYIFDLYGAFEFKHSGTILIQTLLGQKNMGAAPICYGHVTDQTLEILVVRQKDLLLYNFFNYSTKEDFLYYILFVFEQLGLDTERHPLKLFGSIEENDAYYKLCYDYIQNVSVFTLANSAYIFDYTAEDSIDLTVLGAL